MANLQEIFNRITEAKKEQKEIKKMYKDALGNSQEYNEVLEKIKVLREKKKSIENSVSDDFSSEISKLETLKLDIENDTMLLSDAALTKLMNGEKVEIEDESGSAYEPIFSVKFKKS